MSGPITSDMATPDAPADPEQIQHARWKQARESRREIEAAAARAAALKTHLDTVRAELAERRRVTGSPHPAEANHLDALVDEAGRAWAAVEKAEAQYFALGDADHRGRLRGRYLAIAAEREAVETITRDDAERQTRIAQLQIELAQLEQQGVTVDLQRNAHLRRMEQLQPRSAVTVRVDPATVTRIPPDHLLVRPSQWAAAVDRIRAAGAPGPVDFIINETTGTVTC